MAFIVYHRLGWLRFCTGCLAKKVETSQMIFASTCILLNCTDTNQLHVSHTSCHSTRCLYYIKPTGIIPVTNIMKLTVMPDCDCYPNYHNTCYMYTERHKFCNYYVVRWIIICCGNGKEYSFVCIEHLWDMLGRMAHQHCPMPPNPCVYIQLISVLHAVCNTKVSFHFVTSLSVCGIICMNLWNFCLAVYCQRKPVHVQS